MTTTDPADLIAAHVAAARDPGGGVSSSNVSAQAAVEHATPRPRTPQARFDADGLPRGLMPIAGIRCGEWL
jgi:hypothetical protein